MNVKNADSGIPVLLLADEEVTVRDPESQEIRKLRQHDRFGRWTLMAVLRRDGLTPIIVLEDLTVKDGHIVYLNEAGVLLDLPKTLEPTRVAEDSCYRGHSKEEIIDAAEDILGREILEQDGDPSYEVVAPCVPPIRHTRSGWGETAHTFVGSRDNLEAVPFYYNGSSYNFTPVNYAPEVGEVMQARGCLGRAGGRLASGSAFRISGGRKTGLGHDSVRSSRSAFTQSATGLVSAAEDRQRENSLKRTS